MHYVNSRCGAELPGRRDCRVSSELAADPAIVAVHAMAPFGATLKPAAGVAVRLPADAGVADGTAVIHTDDVTAIKAGIDGALTPP